MRDGRNANRVGQERGRCLWRAATHYNIVALIETQREHARLFTASLHGKVHKLDTGTMFATR
jgi:hypothetical protein